jgi:hypothetical protein
MGRTLIRMGEIINVYISDEKPEGKQTTSDIYAYVRGYC